MRDWAERESERATTATAANAGRLGMPYLSEIRRRE
jgi:hypothetical protein